MLSEFSPLASDCLISDKLPQSLNHVFTSQLVKPVDPIAITAINATITNTITNVDNFFT